MSGVLAITIMTCTYLICQTLLFIVRMLINRKDKKESEK